ncbi:calcium homeostasis modulator protein 6-like, partial [Clarias magur]
MDNEKRITNFLKSRVGNLGIATLVLVVLEKMMDADFICPCQPGYNEVICACYAIVPFITCFAFTLSFVDPKPEDRGLQGNRYLFSTLISLIWLFLFFIDGRYVSCACSRWGGEYTETGDLKWCKHNESETVAFENQQETQRCITISQ